MSLEASNTPGNTFQAPSILVLNKAHIRRLADLAHQHPAKTEFRVGFLTQPPFVGLHAWPGDALPHKPVPLFDVGPAAAQHNLPVRSAK